MRILGDKPLPTSTPDLIDQLAERNAQLCTAIRAGEYDEDEQLLAHLKAVSIAQLEVANPKFLAQLAKEDAN